jgi:hypothetical protein
LTKVGLYRLRSTNASIPDIPIGLGRVITDLHYVDFSKMNSADAFGALLRGLGVDSPNLGKVTTGQSGWPFHLRIVRKDKYVGKVPFRYWFAGKIVADSRDSLIELQLTNAGEATIYCDTMWFIPSIFGLGANPKGWHYRGISDKIAERFISGHRYELFVSGDNIWERLVTSPYVEMARYIYMRLGAKMVDPDNSQTWPRIQINLSKL